MATIRLEAAGTSLHLCVTIPGEPDEEGSYAMTDGEIAVDCGVFRGSFNTYVYASDLQDLRRALVGLREKIGQQAEAACGFLEGTLTMKWALDRLGHLTTEIAVGPAEPGAPSLRCFLEADQTYLAIWVKSIDTALDAFPTEWQRLAHDL